MPGSRSQGCESFASNPVRLDHSDHAGMARGAKWSTYLNQTDSKGITMEELTQFKILSHACLLVKRKNICLIIDPWIIGSCYWGSWWNYPEPILNEEELQEVTHVLISHIHWDHWHGTSLKKFFKGRQFIIPDEPKTRSYDDLVKLELGPVIRTKHNQTIKLAEDFKITTYQFGLFLNDSVIVVETPQLTLLNANDAKIAGLPLKQILKNHAPFDFAFRSHSTANFRSCITVQDDTTSNMDNYEHYSLSFQLFMNVVKPTYAIPFASNHCHLHKDTFHFNQVITNPLVLQNWLNQHGGLRFSQLKIMLPGSQWSSQTGFHLRDLEPFNNIDEKLKHYQLKNQQKLDQYYVNENQKKLTSSNIKKHETHLKAIPKLLRILLKPSRIAYQVISQESSEYYNVDYLNCCLKPITRSEFEAATIKISWPVFVLKQAIALNMYAHAFISKRVSFVLSNSKEIKKTFLFIGYLEKIEHEFFPLSLHYLKRLFFTYAKRWRELFVYGSAFNLIMWGRKSLFKVEETILRRSAD